MIFVRFDDFRGRNRHFWELCKTPLKNTKKHLSPKVTILSIVWSYERPPKNSVYFTKSAPLFGTHLGTFDSTSKPPEIHPINHLKNTKKHLSPKVTILSIGWSYASTPKNSVYFTKSAPLFGTHFRVRFGRSYEFPCKVYYIRKNLPPRILKNLPPEIVKNPPPEIVEKVTPQLVKKVTPQLVKIVTPQLVKSTRYPLKNRITLERPLNSILGKE